MKEGIAPVARDHTPVEHSVAARWSAHRTATLQGGKMNSIWSTQKSTETMAAPTRV